MSCSCSRYGVFHLSLVFRDRYQRCALTSPIDWRHWYSWRGELRIVRPHVICDVEKDSPLYTSRPPCGIPMPWRAFRFNAPSGKLFRGGLIWPPQWYLMWRSRSLVVLRSSPHPSIIQIHIASISAHYCSWRCALFFLRLVSWVSPLHGLLHVGHHSTSCLGVYLSG